MCIRDRFVINPKTGKEKIITTREIVNTVLEENQSGKIQHFYAVSFPWPDKEQMLIKLPGKYIVYDFKNNQIVSTTAVSYTHLDVYKRQDVQVSERKQPKS